MFLLLWFVHTNPYFTIIVGEFIKSIIQQMSAGPGQLVFSR